MVVKVASANDKISTKIHILCFSYFKNYKQQSANTNVFFKHNNMHHPHTNKCNKINDDYCCL